MWTHKNSKGKYWVVSQQALFFNAFLARHDDFNDVHIEDKNWNTKRASWNWWWRMVDDDDGDGFPSPEPRTDSRLALPREFRAWRRLRIIKRDESFSLNTNIWSWSWGRWSSRGARGTLQKKTHPWHFGPNEFFFYQTYDTSMTIIVTKPGILIDVVGSYFYDKKSWQKMGSSTWAGRRCTCMTFFGLSMTEKIMVEAGARKISGCSRLRWVVGPSDARFSHTRTHVCVRRWL